MCRGQLVLRSSVIALAAAWLMGCGADDEIVISESRERIESDDQRKVGATSRERFTAPSDEAASAVPENPFRWETPDGWVAQPSSRLRVLDFRIGSEGEGEAYLTALPGGGGGIAANVNRWRQQMGLEAATPEEIAALPERTLLGGSAAYVDLAGDFTGMGDQEAKEDYRLLGLIQENSGFTFFVKLTGPAELVESEEANFATFAESITLRPRQ
ncbi:hypothetical protein BH23VER1_BH23VER1_10240 [soil metagenome]